MLALAFRFIIQFGLLFCSTTFGWASLDKCVADWEHISVTAFSESPIHSHKNCLYLAYSSQLVSGFDTITYKEMIRDHAVLGAIQSGIHHVQKFYAIDSFDPKHFSVLKSTCNQNFCEAVLVFVLPPKAQKIAQSELPLSSQSSKESFWWQGIAERLEKLDFPYTEEVTVPLAQEVETFSGKRAAAFFLGEPVESICIQDQSLHTSDFFFQQNRCPYNALDALNAGQFIKDKGYPALASVFYLRAAADIRSPIFARTALNRLPLNWSELPPSSSGFLACLRMTCHRSKAAHPLCSAIERSSIGGKCFL